MRQIFTFIIIFSLAQVYAQDNPFIAKQTRVIDSLYNKNLLKKKEYDGRTFVGSLSGYYFKDTLVYVNTLTDGEYGGVETKYYCKDTILMKVKSMSTQFADPNEWTEYYKKHKKIKIVIAATQRLIVIQLRLFSPNKFQLILLLRVRKLK